MSAPALRGRARPMAVARAHLAASAPAALLGLAAVVALTWPGSKAVVAGGQVPFVEVRDAMSWMLFLPLLHWRGRGGARALDQGLPMSDVLQEWLRAACGSLWAVLTLGVALAAHLVADPAIRRGTTTFDPGLPISILGTGLATYLLGTAVLMRTDRPGRVLLLTMLTVGVLGVLGEPLSRNLVTTNTVTEFAAHGKHVRVPGWRLTVLLGLVLGFGAMAISTLSGRHGGVFPGLRGRWIAAVHRRPVPLAGAPRVDAGPRQAASFGRAVLRQFMALRSRLGWSAVIVAAIYVPTFTWATFGQESAVEMVTSIAASFWPALVWLDERGRRGDWDESVPLARLPLRLAHAAAGLAWLMVVVLPGAVAHHAGVAVAAAALALYLVSTAVAALLGRPVLGSFVAALGGGLAAFSTFPEHPLSAARAMAPLNAPQGITWSPVASLVWLALLTAAAVAALRFQARRDSIGGTRLPRFRRQAQPA